MVMSTTVFIRSYRLRGRICDQRTVQTRTHYGRANSQSNAAPRGADAHTRPLAARRSAILWQKALDIPRIRVHEDHAEIAIAVRGEQAAFCLRTSSGPTAFELLFVARAVMAFLNEQLTDAVELLKQFRSLSDRMSKEHLPPKGSNQRTGTTLDQFEA